MALRWWRCVCEDEVESGKLELHCDEVCEYRYRYCFVSPQDARANQALADFRDWLREIPVAHRDDNTAG